jgi:hypothetical protein
MAGDTAHVYVEDLPLNVTRLAGLHTTIIGTVGSGEDADLEGLARGDSQVWSELRAAESVEAQRGDAHVRLALNGGVIVGDVVIGDQPLSFALQEVIEVRADMVAIAGELAAPQASIVELVDQAWRNLKACGG